MSQVHLVQVVFVTRSGEQASATVGAFVEKEQASRAELEHNQLATMLAGCKLAVPSPDGHAVRIPLQNALMQLGLSNILARTVSLSTEGPIALPPERRIILP